MFARFGKWLRPNAEDVTLEVIGLIKGTRELQAGAGNALAADDVARIAKRAQNALKKEGHVISPDVKELLTKSAELFGELGQQKSSRDTGRYEVVAPYGAFPEQEPDPAWTKGYTKARRQLDTLATRVFSTQFAPQIRGEIANMNQKELAAKTKREPEAMALMEGHLRKPPAL